MPRNGISEEVRKKIFSLRSGTSPMDYSAIALEVELPEEIVSKVYRQTCRRITELRAKNKRVVKESTIIKNHPYILPPMSSLGN